MVGKEEFSRISEKGDKYEGVHTTMDIDLQFTTVQEQCSADYPNHQWNRSPPLCFNNVFFGLSPI